MSDQTFDEKWAVTRAEYYEHIHKSGRGHNGPHWRGTRVVKYASDMIMYAEAIYNNKPDWIVETGTYRGGSALFLNDMVRLFGGKGVITIDVKDRNPPKAEGIIHMIGSSVDPAILQKVREIVGSDRVMVVLDSDHSKSHVLNELLAYNSIVTKGQYIVVEDCYTRREQPYGPYWAVQRFIKRYPEFKVEFPENRYVFAISRGGWLKRA